MMSWKHNCSSERMPSPTSSFLVEISASDYLPKLTQTDLFLSDFNKHTRIRHLLSHITALHQANFKWERTATHKFSLEITEKTENSWWKCIIEDFFVVFLYFFPFFFFFHSRMHKLDIAMCLSQQYPNWFLN